MNSVYCFEIKCLSCSTTLHTPKEGNYFPLQGVWGEASGTYGSSYDMSETFQFIICDNCITQALKDGNKIFMEETTVKKTFTVAKNSEDLYNK